MEMTNPDAVRMRMIYLRDQIKRLDDEKLTALLELAELDHKLRGHS